MEQINKIGVWSLNGELDDMCFYWSNKGSQVVIMDKKQYYEIYSDLNKCGDKILKFEVSFGFDTSATTKKEIIGNYDTVNEAVAVAIEFMKDKN
jgi:hypothetical protein